MPWWLAAGEDGFGPAVPAADERPAPSSSAATSAAPHCWAAGTGTSAPKTWRWDSRKRLIAERPAPPRPARPRGVGVGHVVDEAVVGCFVPEGPGRARTGACGSGPLWVPVARVAAKRARGTGPGAGAGAGKGIAFWTYPVTDPCASRHVAIKDGEQTVAAAQVAASRQAGGTVRASL